MHTAERVGGQVGALRQVESTVVASGEADGLVINVGGGHINTTETVRFFCAVKRLIHKICSRQVSVPGVPSALF